jgi:uroporphyrin-III C-methyltransferase
MSGHDAGPEPGTVALVGAGPGDPDLLTVKARRLLDGADVVLHDSLVRDAILETVPQSVELIDVGKRPDDGGRRWAQAEINRRLVREADHGNAVVRLKGGDSTVFGRGGEEAEHLADEGVPFEIVPGVTSAVAAPAVAGIPATHRECASSLTVVTGHEDPTKADSALDWDALADTVIAGGTLVILMGVGRLPANVAALRAGGVPDSTPVAFVERATWPDGDLTLATLSTAVRRRDEEGIEPPAVIVVGDVVDVRERIGETLQSRVQRAEATENAPALVRDGQKHRETVLPLLDLPEP